MGKNVSKPMSQLDPKENKDKEDFVSRASFDYLGVIGKGGFGKVWKVHSKKYKKQYAMKEMSKAKIIDKKSEKSIKYERDLLSRMKHPFIINMHFAFQDTDNLYLVMDLLTGGDLRYHICKYKKFSEEQTKFFMACIILGLEYCHANNILHRDIKPENLVLDEKGYVKITDFGIAKIYQKENSSETSGTPGYMSPEVMCAQNHTIAVDYFALGVIGYEFMNGVRPYLGRSRKEIKEKVMAKQVQVKKGEIPDGWSVEAADFINRLLQRKPVNRLGLRGAAEVKEHSWLKYYPWKDLYLGKLESPFVPKMGDNFDYKYCNAPDKIGINTQERYAGIVNSPEFPEAFRDYYYFNREIIEREESTRKDILRYNNPHIIYLESVDTKFSDSNIKNRNILSAKVGTDETKLNTLRRMPGSQSASTLIKTYKQQANSSSTTNISSSNTSSIGNSNSNSSISPQAQSVIIDGARYRSRSKANLNY